MNPTIAFVVLNNSPPFRLTKGGAYLYRIIPAGNRLPA